MQLTHREHKKQQTREGLIMNAHRLFAEQGYDATTIADIAAAANCAPRTFFQYFRSKEDLLLVGIDNYWDDFAAALTKRSSGTTALEATREWMIGVAQEFEAKRPSLMQTLGGDAGTITLSAQARAQLYSINKMKEVLIPEIARDLGVTPDALEPHLIAAMVGSVFDAYHNDSELAKTKPQQFIDCAFNMLKSITNEIRKG